MESEGGANSKIDLHFSILLYSHIQSDVILHLSPHRLVNTIKHPSFDRRIANSIATTNNDNIQIRSRIPARTRFGGLQSLQYSYCQVFFLQPKSTNLHGLAHFPDQMDR
jgi:hypothetical protein